jgi:hypothetical protein
MHGQVNFKKTVFCYWLHPTPLLLSFNAAKMVAFFSFGGGGRVEATSTSTKMLVLLSVNQICNLGSAALHCTQRRQPVLAN